MAARSVSSAFSRHLCAVPGGGLLTSRANHNPVDYRRQTTESRTLHGAVFQSAISEQLDSRVSSSVQPYRSLHTSTYAVLLFPSRAARAKLMTAEGARDFVDSLNLNQRRQLEAALNELKEEEAAERRRDDVEKRESDKETETNVEVTPPTWRQLRLLCYQQSLPFLGFGFLDNFIMITVGEYIDITIGAALTISTMAAAGLGNLISDLAGLGLADRVEALCRLIGIPNPQMSSAQLHYRASRWMGLLGRCLGISVGCLVGMLPLLWFDHSHKEDEEEAKSLES